MSTINTLPTSSAGATAFDSTSALPPAVPKTLGQDDFLKLLVSQMQSQDPLNPQKDTDFIAQMAQFSSLEQSKSMSAQMTQMNQGQQITQASSMLGKVVLLQGADGQISSGQVTGVTIDGTTPLLIVNGEGYKLSQVVGFTPTQM
ncbi:MAG TPA: flagellar hook capping FlgD N-terminal domain-containing protein [Candidatus Limnocylindria bacterium]|jgi:flagellar basal-body rod modification protein FlgD|nr:flagellar hook capping FlgD N-terminal domain-containing protein [Candidatus Limnocylindria bacterium]